MAKHSYKQHFVYDGSSIILTTKHGKSSAIAPPFQNKLGATVLEYIVDTDELGTFSGEISRPGNALECARLKCEWSLKLMGDKIEFALGSEGSFGPHPLIPFLPCDQEILYFIDRRHGFELHLSHLSTNTNYQMQTITSLEDLHQFAQNAQFPSHALILRPNARNAKTPIFKGINSEAKLEEAFRESLKYTVDSKVFVETDMRAHLNPTRMQVISELADKLAQRLATDCPKCHAPGWGQVRVTSGLACRWCGSETEMIKHEVFGCTLCPYEAIIEVPNGLKGAEPENCQYCNP